jgi:hypothetical protein
MRRARRSRTRSPTATTLDHTVVTKRYFTPEEASELLSAVRPLAERMVEHRRALTRALERIERLRATVAGNGGDLRPRELGEAQAEVERAAAGVARCAEDIHELGGIVKDPEAGLVDFPALRDGGEVLLCWRVGEDEIRYWHSPEEGFAGRRELPL